MKLKLSFAKAVILSIFILTSVCSYSQNQVPDSISQAGLDTLSSLKYDVLDEFVIEVQKPVLQSDGVKTTYNVESDPASNSSTVLDVLKKVPMVSVDGEGNVRLNGESNFKFQINGQENPMLQQYADKILAAMPANSIVRIEVITEPGAKEDAEGTAGIINIVTEQKKSQDGYSGSLSARFSNRNMGPSFYGILKKDKVTISANVDYQWGFNSQKSEMDNNIHYLNTENAGYLNSYTYQKGESHYIGGNINMSYEPNRRNLFTLSSNIFYVNGSVNDFISSNRRYDSRNNLMWLYSQNGNADVNFFNLSVNASYRHNFTDKKNYLIFSYLLNFGKNNWMIDQWITELENYAVDYNLNDRSSRSYNRGHTIQIDYANDFNSDKHLFEAGAKGIFRYNSANSSYKSGNSKDDMEIDRINSTDIDQPQDIYAGYLAYTGKYNSLTVNGGIRYEHTKIGIRYKPFSTQDFTNYLNDWVPNASLTWSFSAMSNLRAGYQMRISRPSIDQVNPFEMSISPFEMRKGNPDLTSERSHKVSLTYTNFGRLCGGNIGVEYTVVDNAISSYSYMLSQNGVNTLVTSFANIGKTDNISVRGFFNWNIIKNMSLNIYGSIGYLSLKSPAEGLKNSGITGNIGGAWSYVVDKDYKFSAFGAYYARRLNLQGYNSGFYYYGISAGKDFLANKSLNISVSASNFAQKSMSFKSKTETTNSISNSTWKNLTAWNIGLSITWKFGSLNAQVKKTGADVNNDDINTSSNQNQGGGNGGL